MNTLWKCFQSLNAVTSKAGFISISAYHNNQWHAKSAFVNNQGCPSLHSQKAASPHIAANALI